MAFSGCMVWVCVCVCVEREREHAILAANVRSRSREQVAHRLLWSPCPPRRRQGTELDPHNPHPHPKIEVRERLL